MKSKPVLILAFCVIFTLVSRQFVEVLTWLRSPEPPAVVRTPSRQIKPLTKSTDWLQATGASISVSKAESLERQLSLDPGNQTIRALLLYFYEARSTDPNDARRMHEQYVWFLANSPGSPVLRECVPPDDIGDAKTYALCKQLFESAVKQHPNRPEVLANYGRLVFLEHDQSIDLLTRAAKLDPRNPERYADLAHSYSLAVDGPFFQHSEVNADRALANYRLADQLGGSVAVANIIQAAYQAQDFNSVQNEAAKVLKNTRSFSGDDVHAAHTALGQLALKKSDVNSAKMHLLASARVDPTPVLGSFGPEMSLAKSLLAKGERQTVTEYLVECGKFWSDERQVRWLGQLRLGQTPDW
jgi:predicted Zn-dependent protease